MENNIFKNLPKLGFGLMRLPKKDDAIDIEQVKAMVDEFLQAGFKYFDTAHAYEGSEEAFKAAVATRYPRDSFFLATKLPVWSLKSREEAELRFNESLERTGLDYFDFYLLHSLGGSRSEICEQLGLWDMMQEKKRAGQIRYAGFSFHDKAEALDALLTKHPEADFVQLQINYADWLDPIIEAQKCYEVAKKHFKPIIVMEPVKGGTLARLPGEVEAIFKGADEGASPASFAIRFAASLCGVAVVLSGMSDMEQMRDNIRSLSGFEGLSETESGAIDEARTLLESYRSVACTACGYCLKSCPQAIQIPDTIAVLNRYRRFGGLEAAKTRYAKLGEREGKNPASACIDCGVCEEVCPQRLKIRDALKEAVGCFSTES
ncbi:MAG: aldo/keto reductase [Clostridia bacterium]|nr:aldo/keto reductase [Clostridia bacterium]